MFVSCDRMEMLIQLKRVIGSMET